MATIGLHLDGAAFAGYCCGMRRQDADAAIVGLFGENFADVVKRADSYDLLETFIERAHADWSRAPATERIASDFSKHIAGLPDPDFAFLLCHSGYIPEVYGADSSQETLYSKLIEVLVGEWARRLGFEKTTLPTAKSSVEDVTITDGTHVIVCDAKSFRLGRSQKAPNVKDALKQGDIMKWLGAYPADRRLGGLVTFPSQHDWSGGSDVYLYLTDKASPIALLFYEHLSFMLLSGCNKERLIKYFRDHAGLFPTTISKKERNRDKYFKIMHDQVISCGQAEWKTFDTIATYVIKERVSHSIARLQTHLTATLVSVEDEVEALDADALRKALVEARYSLKSHNLTRQIANIRSFRSTLD